MNYHLSFHKKPAMFIFVAGSVVSALLFLAGYGVGLNRGYRRAQVELVQQPVSVQSQPGAKGGQGPVEQGSAGQRASGATEAYGTGEKGSTVDLSQSASSEPPEPGGPIASKDGFTVQVGAFQMEAPAQQLKDKFIARGYSAFVFQGRDSAGQAWYVVRIGHFKKLEPATRAAVNFTMREKAPAHVRPLSEL